MLHIFSFLPIVQLLPENWASNLTYMHLIVYDP